MRNEDSENSDTERGLDAEGDIQDSSVKESATKDLFLRWSIRKKIQLPSGIQCFSLKCRNLFKGCSGKLR